MATADHPVSMSPEAPSRRDGAVIAVRPVDAAHGVIITVSGSVTAPDATELGAHLRREFDREPSVVVVDLSAVPACDRAGLEVLSQVRDRAQTSGIALHLVHLGAPDARAWLADARLL
jgi:anti-anti-sigma regulatory factor